MQTPFRKPGKYSQQKTDPLLTKGKFKELEAKLKKLKSKKPKLASEVSRLAELGDFSENVEYQLAKRRLRGTLGAITRLENQLNHAEIIKPKKTGVVQVGSVVVIEVKGNKKTYEILGSTESDPGKGVISHSSPIGAVLLGGKAGDVVEVDIGGKGVEYKIKKVK